MNDIERYNLYLKICADRDRCPYAFDHWKRVIDKIKPANAEKYPHYFPEVPQRVTHIDVYRVLKMFGVDDACLQHALKKILCAGRRGAKDSNKDVQEAIDALNRYLEMVEEDKEPEL